MALIRNISGIPKLGAASPEMDMQRMMEENYGGGGYYDPVYPQVPLVEPEPAGNGPMAKDYGGGGGQPMPEGFYGPDGTGGQAGPSDQQPVYPILPIRGYEEIPAEPVEVVNTVSLTGGSSDINIASVGALAGAILMALGARPKGALGTIAYLGSLGLLWMQLHYQHPETHPAANVQ